MTNYKKGPSEIHFTFMLKGSKILSDGLSPIVFRALFRAQRKFFLLKQSIHSYFILNKPGCVFVFLYPKGGNQR